MYIRKTKTRSTSTGEAYYSYRLVTSVRINGKVRQKTLLNLGSSFALPEELWPELACRIDQLVSRQPEMFTQTASAAVETLAQRYFALLVKKREAEAEEPQPDAPLAQQQGASSNVAPDFQEDDSTPWS